MDLNISIHEGQIHTDLHRKPTDKPRVLIPSSAHPSHIFQNIVYSMAFRLLRICSKEEYFEKRLSELKNEFLIPRGYKAQIIESQFKRVRNLEGNSYTKKRLLALEKISREVKDTNRIVVPFDFNPKLPKISHILRKHHKSMIMNSLELKKNILSPQ